MRIITKAAEVQPYPRYAACSSIKDYGAKGNGTADDAVALQRAIDAVAEGCSIYFPPGRYRLASAVTVRKHVVLQLGPQVRIVQHQDAAVQPDIENVRDLTVQGEGPFSSVWASSGFSNAGWSPFSTAGATAGPAFRRLALRSISMEHNVAGYPVGIRAAKTVYEITDVVFVNPYYVFIGQEVGLQSLTMTRCRFDGCYLSGNFENVGSTVLRDVVIEHRGAGEGALELRISGNTASLRSQVLIQNLDVFPSGGAGTRLYFWAGSSNAGLISAIIQGYRNYSASRLFSADAFSGRLNLTVIGATFSKASHSEPAVELNDQSGAGVIECVLVGVGFRQDGATNAFPAVARSLSNAGSVFEAVACRQLGWSSI